MIRNSAQRHERKKERLELRRRWKIEKPRPLNDLIKNSASLIKWLMLGGGLLYLLAKGGALQNLIP